MARPKGHGAPYETRMTPDELDDLRTNGFVCGSEDCGRILGISKLQVQRLAAKGELPGRKVGRQWRFRTDRIIALLDGGVI